MGAVRSRGARRRHAGGGLHERRPDLLNGDRLTGEVKELFLGQLKYSTDDLGTTYIEWDKVARLTAAGEFELELESGEVMLGMMGAGPSAGEMALTTESDVVIL